MTVEIATLGVKVTPEGVEQTATSLDKLAPAGERAEKSFKDLEAASKGASGAVKQSVASFEDASGALGQMIRQVEAAVREQSSMIDAHNRAAMAAYKQAEAEEKVAKAAGELQRRVAALTASVDPLQSGIDRVNRELDEADALFKQGAISAQQFAQANQVLGGRLNMLQDQHAKVGKAARLTGQETMNMGRQFADVGVMAAMGMNPLMILVSQGPQIADIFHTAGLRGMGFGAVMKDIGGMATKLLPIWGPIGLAAGAAFGAAALAARAMNKDNADAAKSLGLTAKQLDYLKDKGVSTSITIGDVFKGTWDYVAKSAMTALSPVTDFFSGLFDKLTSAAFKYAENFVATWYAGIKTLTQHWRELPQVVGAVFTNMINDQIAKIETLVRAAISGFNTIATLGNKIPGLSFQTMDPNKFTLGRVKQADNQTARDYTANLEDGRAAFRSVMAGLGTSITAANRDRLTDELKHGPKESDKQKKAREIRDMEEERLAEATKALASARAEELQIQLGLTTDIHARAQLERQILAQQTTAKNAEVDGKIAAIKDQLAKELKAYKDGPAKEQVRAGGEMVLRMWNGVQAQNDINALQQQQLINRRLQQQVEKEALELKLAGRDDQIALMTAQADTLRSAYARGVAEEKILKAQQAREKFQLEEVVRGGELAGHSAQEVALAKQRLQTVDQINAANLEALEQNNRLVDALADVTASVRGFKQAFRGGDIANAVNALLATLQTIQASVDKQGMSGGLMTAGAAVGSLVGGRGGRALANGLGMAAGAGALSSGLAALGGSVALSGAGGAAVAAGAGLAQMSLLLSSAVPVIGVIAGLATLLGPALKGKPSNNAAIATITGDAYNMVSTGRETAETSKAAGSAAEAIIEAQNALKSFGLSLKTTVTGIDIGTRDLTHVLLSSGQELRTAVGDSAAAVEAGLKAVLDGATYVDSTQEALVKSMVAAGKGFDDIANALQGYATAQAAISDVQLQILKYTDPKAYDVQLLEKAQKARRDEAKAWLDAGYMTVEQFDRLAAEIKKLDAAELKDALSRYAGTIDDARDALRTAYENEAAVIQKTIDLYQELVNSLSAYQKSLYSGPAAMLSPEEQYRAAKGDYERVSKAALGGDEDALKELQAVSQAYLDASKDYYGSSEGYFKDLEAVRKSTASALDYAKDQLSEAEEQLNELKKLVEISIEINKSVISVREAIIALDARLAAESKAAAAAVVANDNAAILAAPSWFDPAVYGKNNPDIAEAAKNYAAGNNPYGYPTGLTAAQYLTIHYNVTGKDEIAKGDRKYATGGSFKVAGSAASDATPIRFTANRGEVVSISREDNMAKMVEALDRVERAIMAVGRMQGAGNEAIVEGVEKVREGLDDVQRQVAASR